MCTGVFKDLREAEVDQLDGGVGLRGLKQEVFGLEVSMNDLLLVAVEQRQQDLLEDECGFLLREVPRG